MFVEEISAMSKLLHPNLLQAISSFVDKGRNECCLVTELMPKDLRSFINENSSPRKRIPFSLPRAIDIMLQIARGVEYLHAYCCHSFAKPLLIDQLPMH
jgi:serine/threonine protein kinase